MIDLNLYDRFKPGDFVEHKLAHNVVWEVVAVDLYGTFGPQATLKYVGGNQFTHEMAYSIFTVFADPSSQVSWIRDLVEANAMLTLAVMAQHR